MRFKILKNKFWNINLKYSFRNNFEFLKWKNKNNFEKIYENLFLLLFYYFIIYIIYKAIIEEFFYLLTKHLLVISFFESSFYGKNLIKNYLKKRRVLYIWEINFLILNFQKLAKNPWTSKQTIYNMNS